MIKTTQHIGHQKPEPLINIQSTITKHLNVSRIYMIGKRLLLKQQHSNYPNESKETILQTHYDLLVFTIKSYPNGISEVQDQIAATSDGTYDATIFLHREIHLQQLTQKQQYFFYNIIKPKNLLFQDPNYYYNPLAFINPTIPVNFLVEFWKNKQTTALSFLEAVKGVKKPTASGVVLFNLHQAAEQISLGLIAVYLNYYPTYFHLNYLFNICSHFTEVVANLFDSKIKNQMNLINLLTQNPCHIRKDKPLVLTNSEISYLQNILERYIVESSNLVNEKLKLQNKNQT